MHLRAVSRCGCVPKLVVRHVVVPFHSVWPILIFGLSGGPGRYKVQRILEVFFNFLHHSRNLLEAPFPRPSIVQTNAQRGRVLFSPLKSPRQAPCCVAGPHHSRTRQRKECRDSRSVQTTSYTMSGLRDHRYSISMVFGRYVVRPYVATSGEMRRIGRTARPVRLYSTVYSTVHFSLFIAWIFLSLGFLLTVPVLVHFRRFSNALTERHPALK